MAEAVQGTTANFGVVKGVGGGGGRGGCGRARSVMGNRSKREVGGAGVDTRQEGSY